MSFGENRGDHRGGGGLAMRSGHGDAVLQAHQLREHFRPRNHGNFVFVGFDDFRVVAFDGRRNDQHVRAVYMSCLMPVINCCAQILQPLGDGGELGVRTRH